MNIIFYEPPPEQRTGGLDQAIRSVQRYLEKDGVTVTIGCADLPRSGARPVVHFHGLWQPNHSRMSARCRQRGVPYIISPHGMLEPWAWKHKRWKKWPYYFLFEQRHIQGATRIVATSQQESLHLEHFARNQQITTIPLPIGERITPDYIRARRKLGWPKIETILLYLSRVHPKKGLHLLLEALAQIGPAGAINTRLVIVGTGADRYISQLRRFIAENVERLPRVQWVGEVWGEDKWAYFQGADLFCLTTYSENFGFAILEACQAGTRVLTTHTTPWDLITTWEGGYVVDAEVTKIKTALQSFFTADCWSEVQRSELSRDVHEHFAWERLGPDYIQLYQDVTTAGGTKVGAF